MFSSDSSISNVDLTGGKILSLYRSVNNPTVATPGREPEPTCGYVFSFQDGSHQIFFYAALFLLESGETVIYPFTQLDTVSNQDEILSMEKSAIEFLEGFGFVMENQNFSEMSWREQAEALRELPFFTGETIDIGPVERGGSETLLIPGVTAEEKRALIELLKVL